MALGLLLTGCNEDAIEKQIGGATAASVEATYAVNRDPLLTDWNSDMGRTLTAFSTRQQVPYKFKVVDTDMVNAFAAPYGYVYVTQGLLDFADSEDEIMAVMGHEIGHVVHRDGIKGFKQSLLFNLAAGLVSSKSETLGGVTAIGLGLLSLHYSREQEYAADDTGTAMAYAAGYNPQGLLDFFTKLHTQLEKGNSSSFLDALLASHPYTPNRRLRQEQQPWVMAATTPSAMRISQGYLVRGQYGRALKLLNARAAQAPEDPQLALMVADALAGRGASEEARGKLQMVSAQTSVRYPSYALAQMTNNPVPVSVPPTAAEQGQALAMAGTTGSLVTQTKQTGTMLAAARQGLAQQLDSARTDSATAMEALVKLSEVDTSSLPKQVQTIAVNANAAVAAAADVMNTLDLCQKLSADAADYNARTGQQAQTLVQSLAQGGGRSGALRLAQSALHEIGKSNQLLLSTADATRAAVGPTREAQDSARQTSEYVQRLFNRQRVRQSDLELAKMMTRETKERAQGAMLQAAAAQEKARLASMRGMLATLQIAEAAAPAEMLPGLDRLVGHYLRTSAGQVATLRERGYGYGEIAVLLAQARGTGTTGAALADQVAVGTAPLDVITLKRDQANGLKVMVKFLGRALADEVVMPAPASNAAG